MPAPDTLPGEEHQHDRNESRPAPNVAMSSPQDGNNTTPHASYSQSGMNILDILTRVATRPSPQVDVGPVDMACAMTIARVHTDSPSEKPQVIFCDASDDFLRLFGFAREAVVGHAPASVLREVNSESTEAAHLYAAAACGAEQQAVLSMKRKDGTACSVLMTLIPLPCKPKSDDMVDESIEWIVGFQATVAPDFILAHPEVEDELHTNFTTPLRRAVEALAKESKQGSTTGEDHANIQMNDDADTFHFVSSRDTLQYVSQSVERLLGYRPEEVIGRPVQELCHPNDIVALLRELKEIKTTGTRTPQRKGRVRQGSGQDETLFSFLAKTSKNGPSRAQFPVKPVRLDESVSRHTVLAEVNGLLRMRHKSGELIWMETSARLVLQPGGSGRKARTVVAVSGRRRKNYADGPEPPAPVKRDPAPPPPRPSPHIPACGPTWLTLSVTGVILQCLVLPDKDGREEQQNDIPARIGYVLPNIIDQGAMHEIHRVMQNAKQRPVSVATWISQTPVISTWVPLTPNLMSAALTRIGARMIVRLDFQRNGLDRPPNQLFDPDPRWLVIPQVLTQGGAGSAPSSTVAPSVSQPAPTQDTPMPLGLSQKGKMNRNESFWWSNDDSAWESRGHLQAQSTANSASFPTTIAPSSLWGSTAMAKAPMGTPVSVPHLSSAPISMSSGPLSSMPEMTVSAPSQPAGTVSMPDLNLFTSAPFHNSLTPAAPAHSGIHTHPPTSIAASQPGTTLPTSMSALSGPDFSLPMQTDKDSMHAPSPLPMSAPTTTMSVSPHSSSQADPYSLWPFQMYDPSG